ncbi:MAG: FAD-dependent monooxygenase [Croceibacterium sp.]
MPPLILGAGPAGCAAAIALGQAGAAPVLLDRSERAGDALCGGFISWRTAERLRALGVDPRQLGAAPVRQLALFAGKQEAVIALPAPAYGLSRRTLDQALRDRALGCGATLEVDTARAIDGTAVVGRHTRRQGDGLFLATGKHDVRGAARQRASADPALGLRWRLPPTSDRRRLLAGRIELHLFAGGYAGIVLQEDGSANLCMAVRKSRLAGRAPADLLARLAEESPALSARLGADWRAVPGDSLGAVPYGFVARTTAAGLFRLGDQAAVIPSLAGEGMAIALASGTLAAHTWLAGGAAGAPAFQRAFAAHAAGPVRAATLAWTLAENRLLARLGIGLASRLPPLVRYLMSATRLGASASLAPPRAAP